jgi:amidase
VYARDLSIGAAARFLDAGRAPEVALSSSLNVSPLRVGDEVGLSAGCARDLYRPFREFATAHARAAIDDLMTAMDLDAIIAPTNGPAWVTDPVNGDLGGDFSTFVGSSSPAAIAGYAAITVPGGFVGPLPVGVTFIGGRWHEPKLIALAYDFEQASRVRVPPRFLPSFP